MNGENLNSIIGKVNNLLEIESQVRERLKPLVSELDSSVRTLQSNAQKLHGNPKQMWTQVIQEMDATIHTLLKPALAKLKSEYESIARERTTAAASDSAVVSTVVDPKRHSFMWQNSLRDSIYLVALLEWLRANRLISLEETMKALEFQIDVEDYLYAITQLPSTFARICIQCVIAEDLKTPFQISEFNNELFAGFRLLNLKNDGLRRKVDALNITNTDCIYDLSIRKLANNSSNNDNNNINNNSKIDDETKKRKLDETN